jgi:LysM repeat protein
MSFFGRRNILLLAAALLLAVAGCSPMDSGSMDEEKEPHYVLGKSRVNAFNYTGAIEAFEESLEANPHSAQAHFQLAMLYENQDSVADPAAAIYHYQQYLKYDPNAENADLIRQHVATCKQKLAENVNSLPSTSAAQLQLEKLADENRRLHEQLAQWQAYYEAQKAAARTNPPAAQYYNNSQPSASTAPQQATSPTPDDVTTPSPTANTGTVTPAAGTTASTSASASAASPRRPADSHAARPHTHVVAGGETMASIARKCGVSLNALEVANPYVNPRKLKAGQVLNLPAQ